MSDYSTVQTATLKAIIAATSFADTEARARVDELFQLERLLLCPGDKLGYAGAMSLHQLRREHPVVAIQLEAELRDGTVLRRDEAERIERELRLRAEARERQDAEQARLDQRAWHAVARRTWLAAGGQE